MFRQLKVASCAWCNSDMPPSKQVIHNMPHCLLFTAVAEWRGDVTHSRMLLRHGPASVRNLFRRLHWPRGRSIPGSWMVELLTGSVILLVKDINDLVLPSGYQRSPQNQRRNAIPTRQQCQQFRLLEGDVHYDLVNMFITRM